MDFVQVKFNSRSLLITFIFVICLNYCVTAWNTEYLIDGIDGYSSAVKPHIVTLKHSRQRRDVPHAAPQPPTPPALGTTLASSAPAAPPAAPSTAPATNATDDSNKTTVLTGRAAAAAAAEATIAAASAAAVTQVPLLGVNGSGIRHVTENTSTVSEPIVPDDDLNVTEILRETPEMIQAEHNTTNLTYDNHDFYNSTFIGNVTFFKEHWANISRPPADIHGVLSTSHRRATTVVLKFPFPFYGYVIHNVTVATGGFLHTGEHIHGWLAATQYIAPLMANFDTKLNNDSVIKMSDDGEKFTTFWENVALQEEPNLKFTFAVTLYKNGDIIFAYKNVLLPVHSLNETLHPVKVGISDAFVTDKIVIYVRRKTIYEYHRANFKNYNITNNTILVLKALSTCMEYDNCHDCINHNTAFNCSWCSQVQKCSSGTDKNKQDWTMRHCDKLAVKNISSCPVKPAAGPTNASTTYHTGSSDAVIRTFDEHPTPFKTRTMESGPPAATPVQAPAEGPRAHVGAALAACTAVALVCAAAAWVVYAFRNPHTRSGQLLIKYRPSQWSWRRGEARYTAATIHM